VNPAWLLNLIVAVASVLFTILSFWLLNIKRGRLECAAPKLLAVSAGSSGGRQTFQIRLPLALLNLGGPAWLIDNVRMTVARANQAPVVLDWVFVVEKLMDQQQETSLPVPLVVKSRDAAVVLVEVKAMQTFSFSPGEHTFTLEVRAVHDGGWHPCFRRSLAINGTLASILNRGTFESLELK
jgi:hypothetical protein